jgi:mevalonate pyrophosphate decarboxylase
MFAILQGEDQKDKRTKSLGQHPETKLCVTGIEEKKKKIKTEKIQKAYLRR